MRNRFKIALAVLIAAFLGVPTVFFIGTRHVPWTIPEDERPPAELLKPNGGLSLRYLGVTGYEVTDGNTVILLDPTPTRPTPLELLTGPLVPDDAHGAEVCPRADYILVNHTHHDHALDVPSIALRTGAKVLGSRSTVNLALSRGVPAEHTQVVTPGEHLTLGTFTVDVHRTRHAHIAGISQPMAGVVSPTAGPLWFWQYGLDETLAYRLEANGTSIWFHSTSTFAKGEIGDKGSPTLIMGVTGEKLTPEIVDGVLAEVKPVRVLPTHYDNFFQPMQKGIAEMPGFDLEASHALFAKADPRVRWVVLDYNQTIFLPPDPVAP